MAYIQYKAQSKSYIVDEPFNHGGLGSPCASKLFILHRLISTKFQVNPMRDVEGVAETRSLGRPAGRSDGITHTRTDEGHFYSPPPPTSGDNQIHHLVGQI